MQEKMYAYYAFGGQLMGIYPSEWDAKWASRLRDPSDEVEIKIVYVTMEVGERIWSMEEEYEKRGK